MINFLSAKEKPDDLGREGIASGSNVVPLLPRCVTGGLGSVGSVGCVQEAVTQTRVFLCEAER